MNRPKAIIFDWDGTLLRTLDLWLAAYRAGFEARGHTHDDQTIVAEFFTNHDTIPERHPGLDFQSIYEDALAHVTAGVGQVALYEGAGETLAELTARQTPMALVTSSDRAILDRGITPHGLIDHFHSTLTGSDGFGHKPAPEPFLETLARLGTLPEETLIIGDSLVDIQAGHAVGCQTCLFAPESNHLFHRIETLRAAGPDHEIDRLDGLLDIL